MKKRYEHNNYEDRVYKRWEKSGGFSPIDDSEAQPYTIIMPPPNANDPLHVGHAMFVAIEDILIRFARMKGAAALWLPGTDHAGIETQFVFEKKLAKKGKSRFDFDRERLFQMIWDYVQENSDVAVRQLKKIGASADWTAFKFMLEPEVVEDVVKTFELLDKKGMVYRDLQLVNYCTRCGTAFSSLEVVHEERVSPFYKIKYGPFVVGTVRPETKFRDVALAVNPEDERYKDYVGKTYKIQGLLGPVEMKIIADSEVDPEFGTGIVKVTPAHDPHDFELSKKHDLPVEPIIGFDGRMDFSWFLGDPKNKDSKYLARAKKYHGLRVAAMREEMVKDFEEDGLLVDCDPGYKHVIGVCYRCGRPLEPLPLAQFFIKVKPLVGPVLEALKKKELKVYGSGHDKILIHWLVNLKDWNVSRQIVWGIRLPVWYQVNGKQDIEVKFLDKGGKLHSDTAVRLLKRFSLEEIKKGLQSLRAPSGAGYVISKESPGDDYIQETDTFDTWFSSAQWPFTTLKNTKPGYFERFYPTQVMDTGYDILPFWVMRMLMMGKFVTGKLPFEKVYLHGLIRDEKGQKMSKSKGNVINPLDVIEKYGADALRMALVIRSTAGRDKNVGEGDVRAMRNLTNKVWNAARFIILNKDKFKQTSRPTPGLSLEGKIKGKVIGVSGDEYYYKYLDRVVDDVTRQLKEMKIGLAAETVYNQFWHWYCDLKIEEAKDGKISQQALLEGMVVFLKLLHPFVPFVTEAVWQELRSKKLVVDEKMLMLAKWPKVGG